jgi:hypothetical protein
MKGTSFPGVSFAMPSSMESRERRQQERFRTLSSFIRKNSFDALSAGESIGKDLTKEICKGKWRNYEELLNSIELHLLNLFFVLLLCMMHFALCDS